MDEGVDAFEVFSECSPPCLEPGRPENGSGVKVVVEMGSRETVGRAETVASDRADKLVVNDGRSSPLPSSASGSSSSASRRLWPGEGSALNSTTWPTSPMWPCTAAWTVSTSVVDKLGLSPRPAELVDKEEMGDSPTEAESGESRVWGVSPAVVFDEEGRCRRGSASGGEANEERRGDDVPGKSLAKVDNRIASP